MVKNSCEITEITDRVAQALDTQKQIQCICGKELTVYRSLEEAKLGAPFHVIHNEGPMNMKSVYYDAVTSKVYDSYAAGVDAGAPGENLVRIEGRVLTVNLLINHLSTAHDTPPPRPGPPHPRPPKPPKPPRPPKDTNPH